MYYNIKIISIQIIILKIEITTFFMIYIILEKNIGSQTLYFWIAPGYQNLLIIKNHFFWRFYLHKTIFNKQILHYKVIIIIYSILQYLSNPIYIKVAFQDNGPFYY